MKQAPHLVLFLVIFTLHFISPVRQSTDSKWYVHTAMSIIREGNTSLDEYELLIRPDDYRIEYFNRHLYSMFPIGTAILIIPLVLAVDQFTTRVLEFDLVDGLKHTPSIAGLEIFLASILIALAAVMIYRIGVMLLEKKEYALVLVFIFAFCTSAWSTATRSLWQHGPSMLMLSTSLYLVLKARGNPALIQYTCLPLAFAYIIRPTNSISVVLITLFVFLQYRQYFLKYVLWALLIAVPFIAFNLSVYDRILPPYYFPNRIGSSPFFLEALAGNLISPGRGLFLFTPVLIFSVVGIVLKVRAKTIERLDYILAAIILLHWISVSSFAHWWAGWSFGPRFFADMIPYLVYFIIPFMNSLPVLSKRSVTLFSIALLLSFVIHMRGAIDQSTWEWNRTPTLIDDSPERLWDWSDGQFLRMKP